MSLDSTAKIQKLCHCVVFRLTDAIRPCLSYFWKDSIWSWTVLGFGWTSSKHLPTPAGHQATAQCPIQRARHYDRILPQEPSPRLSSTPSPRLSPRGSVRRIPREEPGQASGRFPQGSSWETSIARSGFVNSYSIPTMSRHSSKGAPECKHTALLRFLLHHAFHIVEALRTLRHNERNSSLVCSPSTSE
jgi:hypothetical protein